MANVDHTFHLLVAHLLHRHGLVDAMNLAFGPALCAFFADIGFIAEDDDSWFAAYSFARWIDPENGPGVRNRQKLLAAGRWAAQAAWYWFSEEQRARQ
jgi:hypothetical protein